MNRRGFLKGVGAIAAAIPLTVFAGSKWTANLVVRERNLAFHDILTATLQARSKEITANVTSHNALLRALKEKGVVKPFQGGYPLL